MATLRSREDVGRRLLALKGQIEQEKAHAGRLQGELDAILRQLKDDYAVNSVEEGLERVAEEEAALQKRWRQIQDWMNELEELMGDD